VSAQAEMPVEELRALLDSFGSSDNKGKALEDFCAVFFGAIPGVVVAERNLLDDAQSQELDLVLENDLDPNGLGPNLLKPLIFVEAKNWKSPVGSAEVAWLYWKIRMAGSETDGVLVVASGVTGRSEERTSAWNILSAANQDLKRILVLSPKEMVDCATVEDVRQLFRLKKRRLATGNAPLGQSEIRPL
jgi:hypothetical protein